MSFTKVPVERVAARCRKRSNAFWEDDRLLQSRHATWWIFLLSSGTCMSHSWGKYAEKYVDGSKPIDTIFGGWTSMNGPDFLVNEASEPWLEFQWALKSRVAFPKCRWHGLLSFFVEYGGVCWTSLLIVDVTWCYVHPWYLHDSLHDISMISTLQLVYCNAHEVPQFPRSPVVSWGTNVWNGGCGNCGSLAA